MNRKGTGLVHIYFGDGKGKTTTGMDSVCGQPVMATVY